MSNRNFWTALVVITTIAIGAIAYLLNRLSVSEQLNSQNTLDAKCAQWASTYYKNAGLPGASAGAASSYENHWNGKLRKCFVKITQTMINDNFISFDIYDALEGKRYALYIGHQICSPGIVDPKTCQLDSGQIWLSGDDTKDPDYQFGFRGAQAHHIGDADTQRDFLEHIRPLMTN
jgi:hypothetical protein